MKNLLNLFLIGSMAFNILAFDEEAVETPQPEEVVIEDIIDVSEMTIEQMAEHCEMTLAEFDMVSGLVENESNRSTDGDLSGREMIALVVLNRLYSEQFPNTVYEVLYQRNQFRLPNGRVSYRTPTEFSNQAVVNAYDMIHSGEEYPEVLFFRSGHWFSWRPRYGTSSYGGNYFSL